MGLITGRQSHLVHPSNRLYNGECRDLRDAAKTYIAAMRYEHSLFTDEDEFNRESKAMFEKCIATAERVLVEYEKAVGDAERSLAKAWRESGDETFIAFGEALLSGDYSPLAV